MARFSQIELTEDGHFSGLMDDDPGRWPARRFMARFDLFLVREAWDRGVSFEDLADGFGPGLGTMGGDWSGIRDSGPNAQAAMVERALNALFPARGSK